MSSRRHDGIRHSKESPSFTLSLSRRRKAPATLSLSRRQGCGERAAATVTMSAASGETAPKLTLYSLIMSGYAPVGDYDFDGGLDPRVSLSLFLAF